MDAISRLGLDVETSGLARGVQFIDRFERSARQAEREATRLEQRTERLGRQMGIMGGIAGQLATQLGAAFSVWAVIRANDAWVSATNQLRLVTDSARELRDVTNEVFQLSQRTASRFEAMTGLYASIQRAAGEAIGSQREVLRITETIAKLASASGGPESSRNAALFQLRQLLQGSVVQAQEFNSLIDGTPLLVQAIADSLGVTRAELRRMVLDGNLAVTQVISALQEQADEADAIFSRVAFTLGDAWIRVQNAFQKLVGTNLGPLFAGAVEGISFVAENLDALVPVITGVGAAFAVAFAPAAVMAMAGALVGLFNLIAAHPIAALVGAFVAAAVAVDRFGDSLTVAEVGIDRLGVTVEDGVKSWSQEFQRVEVSLRDVFVGLVQVVGENLRKIGDQIGQTLRGAEEEATKSATGAKEAWYEFGGALDQEIERVGNALINAARSALWIFTNLWDALGIGAEIAFRNMSNAARGWAEDLADTLRNVLTFIPEVRFDRYDTSELEAQMRDWGARYSEFQQSIQGVDYMGDFRRSVMGAAGANAANRQAEASARAAEQAAERAAAAAAQASAELQKQITARQALFDDLESQLRLSEREFELYAQTNELLRQFPAYYAQQAAGAEDTAAAARAAAQADAERLLSLQRQVAAQNQQRELNRENERQRRLADALQVGGVAEFEELERTFELIDQFPELYDRMEAGAEGRARAEARTQLALERQTEELTRQAERAEQIARAPIDNLTQGLEQASDDFWTNFADRGFDAFGDLADELKNVFRRLQADVMRSLFDPIVAAIRNGATQTVGSILGQPSLGAPSGGFGFGSILSTVRGPASIGNFSGVNWEPISAGGGAKGAAGAGGGAGSIFGGLSGLSNLGSWGGLDAAGNAVGLFGGAGGVLGGIGQVFGASMIGSSVAQLFGLGGGTGGSIGGTIGGIAGSFFGPIGSIVGSFLGSAIGGLFGDDEEHDWAFADLTRTAVNPAGQGGTWGSKSSSSSAQAVQAMADRVQEGQNLLEEMGATLGRSVTFLQYASNEPGFYRLSDNPGTSIRAGREGDPDSLVNAALGEVLKSANFDNPIIDTVAKAMTSVNKSFEETLSVLGALSSVLPSNEQALTQWGEALKTINDTLKGLAADAPGAAGAINDAYKQAIRALRAEFNASIDESIMSFKDPNGLQAERLLEGQSQRIADAKSLLGDMGDVIRLNSLEMKAFVEQAGGSAEAFQTLKDAVGKMIAEAQAAGDDPQPLRDALKGARIGLKNDFNASVIESINALENPLGTQFDQLLKVQADRVAEANLLLGDMPKVMQLNSLELKAFIEQAGGSAEAFNNLNAVFDELIAKAAAAGQATAPLIDAYNQARAGVVQAFDEDVARELVNVSNPALGALRSLLDAQKARLEQARSIGGNILAVERLNAAEQKAFFKGLTDEQKQALGSYLGLIEDFTGKIAIVLSQLGGELDARIDNMEQMRSDLLRQSDAMRELSENLGVARQSIVDRYGAATPMAQVEQLRERLAGLAEEARGGNDSALNALGQVGEQLIQASRALYGSTTTFRGDFDLVTSILDEAQGLAGSRADELQSEAETLLEQRDLLVEIRDILSAPDPALEQLTVRLASLDANNSAVASLLTQYLQLAAAEAGQELDLGALYAQAASAAQSPDLSNFAAPVDQSGAASNSSQSGASAASQPTQGGNDRAVAEMLAALIDAQREGDSEVLNELEGITRALRNLAVILENAA